MIGKLRVSRRFLFAAWITLLLASTPWVLLDHATANHPWFTTSALHLFSQHDNSTGHGLWDEDYCVDDITGAIGDQAVYNMVYDTFLGAYPRWDGMNGADWRVDLWPISLSSVGPCTAITDPTWVEIQVRVNDPNKPSWCGSASCVDFWFGIPGWAPKHFQTGVMFMVGSHIPPGNPSEYRRNINHEARHVLGLKDPDYTNQFYNGCFSS